MIFLVLVYCILNVLHKVIKNNNAGLFARTVFKVKEFLGRKLFYNSFLRYMIVSNLKLTYTAFGFFLLIFSRLADEVTLKDLLAFGIVIGSISSLVIFPLFLMLFMLKNQSLLDNP